MKRFENSLISLASPFLILIGILAFFQRQDSDWIQSLPALFIGVGLLVSGAMGRRRRRKNLLSALRRIDTEEN